MGTRFRRLGAKVERSILHFYVGRIFATAVSISLGISVYDTQCGAKIFHKDVIPTCFENAFISR